MSVGDAEQPAIDLGTPFHSGIVVADLETAMAQLGAALGVRWAKVQQARYTYASPTGPVPTEHRYTYSMGSAPHVELIEGAVGSIWEPTTQADLHHLGYWAEDLAASSAALTAAGSPIMATHGPDLSNPAVFAYHQPPGAGLWIELVDVSLRAAFAPWLAGGDMLPRNTSG